MGTTLLTARRLWDGETPEIFDDCAVEIEDGRIRTVGRPSEIEAELSSAYLGG